MRFVSTRGNSPEASLREVIFDALAPDGGLYLPSRLEALPDAFLDGLSEESQEAIMRVVADHLLGQDLEATDLDSVLEGGVGFQVPTVEIEPGIHCLELFWGPTLAFKDVGARFMASLMAHFRHPEEEVSILVATSGDTGAAVAHAFFERPGFRVVVLFPHGHVSQAQQRLFTTLGSNIVACAIDGSFDDCQRLVKQAFGDRDLRRLHPLGSANSINVARLLPQVFYYFFAAAQLPTNHGTLFSTPSGNFGNLTAGLLAKRLGLRRARFVAATNVNDVVPEYLETGVFTPRASVSTLANAMDVGNPSNLERIRRLYDDDLDRLRADLSGSRFTDQEVLAAIADVHRRTSYVLDPHSAIGYLGLREHLREGEEQGIFLATAHPAKFADIVSDAIGEPVELPAALRERLELPEKVVELSADYDDFRAHFVAGL